MDSSNDAAVSYGSRSFYRYDTSEQLGTPENINKDLPQVSQMSSIQKSKSFVESNSMNMDSSGRSMINMLKLQPMYDKLSPQPIQVTYSTNSSKSKDNNVENTVSRNLTVGQDQVRMVHPVQTIERTFVTIPDEEMQDTQNEKTVTIKRKITRRKKGSEKVNHLRDSYIERISSPLPVYDSTSDTDDILENVEVIQKPIVSENISLKQTATMLQSVPPIINEEFILPQNKSTIANSNSIDFMTNLNKDEDRLSDNSLKPNLQIRDSAVTRIQLRQPQSNNISSEESYIKEMQTAPLSTYSARKENIKSQQLIDERNLGSRILQAEKNMGHRNEMTEEIETITLQPIGKGIQDLASHPYTTINRSGSRATTPRVFDGTTIKSNYYREESKQGGNYNTMPTMLKGLKVNSARNVNQTSSYDITDSYKHGNSAQRAENTSFVRSSTIQEVKNIPFNISSNEQAHNQSLNRAPVNERAYSQSLNRASANEQGFNTLSNRASNAQTVNSSWHTRTESYSGRNHSAQSQMLPHSNQENLSGNIIITSAEEEQIYTMKMVLDSEDQWYKPDYTRENVIAGLRDKEPGSFLIRNSSTFAGAYGLALKVVSLPENAIRTNDTQSDLIRHFLIETVQDESGNGVRVKGFNDECVYSSLAHLVLAHCQNAIALPLTLILPQTSFITMDHNNEVTAQSRYQYELNQEQQLTTLKTPFLSMSHRSLSSPGVNFSSLNHPNPLHQNYVTQAMYLGKVEVDRLTGDSAIEHAVDKINSKASLKTSTVQIELDSTKGITLNDKMQKLFYTRQIPAQHVLHAGFDPKNREFSSPLLQISGINRGRIMGIVVKKQKLILRENSVHLFCEIDGMTNLNDALTFVKENYLRRV